MEVSDCLIRKISDSDEEYRNIETLLHMHLSELSLDRHLCIYTEEKPEMSMYKSLINRDERWRDRER